MSTDGTEGRGNNSRVFRAQALWCLGFVETTAEGLIQGILNSFRGFRGKKENSGDAAPVEGGACKATGKQPSWEIKPQRLDADHKLI